MARAAVTEDSLRVVFPVVTLGPLTIAHLAAPELDDDGAGYRVICPVAALITDGVRRAEPGDLLIWCQQCSAWAEAAGIALP